MYLGYSMAIDDNTLLHFKADNKNFVQMSVSIRNKETDKFEIQSEMNITSTQFKELCSKLTEIKERVFK